MRKRILVTGVGGFIGSYLVPELEAAGYRVDGIDRDEADLDVPGDFADVVSRKEYDIVVHLAAKTSRLLCEEYPVAAIRDNVTATTFVARECGKRGIKLVYASTSEVYGHQGDVWLTEASPTVPTGIYALTKLWGEQVVKLYVPDALIMRLSMPYGPFQAPAGFSPVGKGRAAIVNFLYQALHRQLIPVHIGAERSLCYVTDTVLAIRMLLEQGRTGIWNVGRDDATVPMRELAQVACTLTGAPLSLIQDVPAPERQVVVKRLSMQKLLFIGWRPTVGTHEGMKKVLAWVMTLPGPDSQ